MSDGIRDELRELLYDSAPPADVDSEALFARTLASEEGAGADLLPPDGLFDLPDDDPAEDPADDPALFDEGGLDDGAGDGLDDAGLDDGLDADPAGDAAADPDPGDPAADGVSDLPDLPGAGW